MTDTSSSTEPAATAETTAAEAEAPTRWNIPFLVDVVIVTNPEQIRKIEQHPDVDRIHGVPTKDKPW